MKSLSKSIFCDLNDGINFHYKVDVDLNLNLYVSESTQVKLINKLCAPLHTRHYTLLYSLLVNELFKRTIKSNSDW